MTNDRFVKRLSRPAALVLLCTGCFQYVPAEVRPLPGPQTEVRVTLAQPWDVPMGEFTLHDVTRIEGIVVEASGDTLGLVARWLHPRIGRKYDALFGNYSVSVTDINQLEHWRFSGSRTVLALGATAALSAVVVAAVWRLVRGDTPVPPPSPTASFSFPR